MKKILMVTVATLIFVACNHEKEEQSNSDIVINQDIITITGNSPVLKKLKAEKIEKRTFEYELSTSGAVKIIPNKYAYIASPFSGRIVQSFVNLGQEVNAGSPIFAISSPSYFETTKDYYQSKEELSLAKKNLKRQKDLLANGVGTQKDVEESEVNFALKKNNFENAVASLKVFQVDTTQLVLGEPLIVRSPIRGRVVENNVVIGQYIKEDSDPVATIAELNKVWVAGQVKEKDIQYIVENDSVEIMLISYPDKKIKGKIFHVNSLIDDDTRSVEVLIECDNSNKLMKPGMYVTVTYRQSIENSIVIPSDAVFQMDDSKFVFIALGNNKYLKQKIVTSSDENGKTLVTSGLKEGDLIVTKGGFYLLNAK